MVFEIDFSITAAPRFSLTVISAPSLCRFTTLCRYNSVEVFLIHLFLRSLQIQNCSSRYGQQGDHGEADRRPFYATAILAKLLLDTPEKVRGKTKGVGKSSVEFVEET